MVLRFSLTSLLLLFAFISFSQRSLKLARKGEYVSAEKEALNEIREYHEEVNNGKALKPKDFVKRTVPFYSLGLINKARGNFAQAQKHLGQADSVYYLFVDAFHKRWYKNGERRVLADLLGLRNMDERQAEYFYTRQIDVARMSMVLGEMDEAKHIMDSTFRLMIRKYGKATSLSKTIYSGYGEYFAMQSMYDSSKNNYEKYILELYNDFNYYDYSLKVMADAYVGLSKAYNETNQYQEAIASARKAVKRSKHRFTKLTDGLNLLGKISATNQLAESYRRNREYEKALKWNTKSLDVFNSKINVVSPEKLPILSTRAQIYWALSDTTNANKAFRELIDIYYQYTQNNFSYLSEHERSFFYRNSKQYLELAKGYYHFLYFNKGYKDAYIARALYEMNINNKGALINSSSRLLNVIYSRNNPDLIGKYDLIRQLRERRTVEINNNQTNQVAATDRQITDIEKTIRAALNIEPEKYLRLDDVINAIGKSTTFVDILKCRIYDVTNGELIDKKESRYTYFIFDGTRELKLVQNETSSTELEGRMYKGYLNFARNDVRDPGVYDAYFKPLAPYLTNERVVIAGDAVYNLLNPRILYVGNGFLADKYDFVSIVSARDLLDAGQANVSLKDITLIGHPDYTTHEQDRRPVELPGTETEIRGISQMVPGAIDQEIMLRGDANEHRVKEMESSSILHFATHGFFDSSPNKDPMYTSGLLLAVKESEGDEDGYLTAYEASNLELKKTFMVVLSACETGQGTFEEGEGVWGLQRAFQAAGVKYIIMSLFKVDDAVTSALMQEFYRNIFAGERVQSAFTKAQNTIRKQYGRPVEWGAFVIKGI